MLSHNGFVSFDLSYVGGDGDDEGRAIAVDNTGYPYVTGTTHNGTLPDFLGFQPFRGGGADAFVARLTPTLTALDYGSYLGGEAQEEGWGIAVDPNRNAYLSGWTNSSSFPTTPGAYREGPQGGKDAYVVKVGPMGSSKVYATYFGGALDDQGYAIAIDAIGNAFVTGSTLSDGLATVDAVQPTNAGNGDAFVTRLDVDGASVIYTTYLGGTGADEGRAIAVDEAGRAYITGSTAADFPVTDDAVQENPGSNGDAFVAELGVVGTDLIYSSYSGAAALDEGRGIALGGEERVFTVGTVTQQVGVAGAFIQALDLVQTRVTNVIPTGLSSEVNQDSEPNLAVALTANPSTRIAAITTFSRVDGRRHTFPEGAWGLDGVAPVWVSTNNGRLWNVRALMPRPPGADGRGDQPLAYNSVGSRLYGAFQRLPGLQTVFVRSTPNPNTTNFGGGSDVVTVGGAIDQPWLQVVQVDGQDRVYMTYINTGTRPNMATIDVSSNGGVTWLPSVLLDGVAPVGQHSPPVPKPQRQYGRAIPTPEKTVGDLRGFLAISPMADAVAIHKRDQLIYRELVTGKEQIISKAPSNSHFVRAAFSPDGKRLALIRTIPDEWLLLIQIKDLTTRNLDLELKVAWNAQQFGFTSDGTGLAAIDTTKTFHVIDVRTGKIRFSVRPDPPHGHIGVRPGFAFSRDGSKAAVTGGAVHVWEMTNGRVLQVFKGEASAFAFSPDGESLIGVGRARPPEYEDLDLSSVSSFALSHPVLTMWDLRTAKVHWRWQWPHLEGSLQSGRYFPDGKWVCFSPDGKNIISSGRDSQMCLWEVATNGQRLMLSMNSGDIVQGIFTASRKFVTMHNSSVLSFWDLYKPCANPGSISSVITLRKPTTQFVP